MKLLKKPGATKTPVRQQQPLRLMGKIADKADGLEASSLKIFDIPVPQLVEHSDNPNQQSEQVFDEVVERIRTEGFDEPIIVYPEIVSGKPTGKFKIASGHHRVKAAQLAGLSKIPAVIREGWDEDRAKIELVARNALVGNLDPSKFTNLYTELKARYGEDQLRRMMGLTGKKQFEALYQGVKKQLSPKQQKKLEEAKEDIKSVEDLSQVVNQIFREHGTKLDKSVVVFKFGGKENIFMQVDKVAHARLKELIEKCEDDNERAGDVLSKLLHDTDIAKLTKADA
jgi:hypothetical protein